MTPPAFFVRANWDDEAGVWFSSTDIPGLAVEADTLAEFEDLVKTFAPELLAVNLGLAGTLPPITLIFEERRRLDLVA